MPPKLGICGCAVSLMFMVVFASANTPIPGLFKTGVDASGNKLAIGDLDNHWIMADGNPVHRVNYSAWMNEPNNAGWITFSSSVNMSGGMRTAELSFDLSGFDPATVNLSGRYSGDDGVKVLLNGVQKATGGGHTSTRQFVINSGFVSGNNTLTFEVTNGGSGPTGLMVTELAGTGTLLFPNQGLKLWLDGQDLDGDGNTSNEPASGSSVSFWTDKSISSFHATQQNTNYQPVTSSGGGVSFDGNFKHLTLGANYLFSDSNGTTVVIAAELNSSKLNNFAYSFGYNADRQLGVLISSNLLDGRTSTSYGGKVLSSPINQTQDAVVSFVVRFGESQTLRLNNTVVGTEAISLIKLDATTISANSTRQGNSGPVTIGGQSKTDYQSSRFFEGTIREVLVFDVALLDTNLSSVETYLMQKWNPAPVSNYSSSGSGYQTPDSGYSSSGSGYSSPAGGYQSSGSGYQSPSGSYSSGGSGYQSPSSGYSSSGSDYQTPAGSYQSPSSSSQTPSGNYSSSGSGYQSPGSGYQTPTLGYQSPTLGFQSPTFGYQTPSAGYQSPGTSFQSPSVGYQSPGTSYQSPSTGFQSPFGGYQTPTFGYQSPTPGFQSPTFGYQTPSAGYQSPGTSFQSPSSGYQSPSTGFQSPSSGYQTPTFGYQPPGMGFQSPSGNYSSPVSGYQSPSGGYQTPSFGYQTPSAGFQSPTVGYQSPGMGYQSPSGGIGSIHPPVEEQAPEPIYAPILGTPSIKRLVSGVHRVSAMVLNDGGDAILEAGFEISRSLSFRESIRVPADLEKDEFSITHDRFESGTAYYVRAYARNSAGGSAGIAEFLLLSTVSTSNAWWADMQEKEHGWIESDWFGAFQIFEQSGWAYHLGLGWIYAPAESRDGIWMWMEQRNWLWTERAAWPYLWSHDTGDWLYLHGSNGQGPMFFNFATGRFE